MTDRPEEQLTRSVEPLPPPTTLIDLVDRATRSWDTTLRLLVLLCATFLVASMLLGLILIGLYYVYRGEFSKTNFAWTPAVIGLSSAITLAAIGARRGLSRAIRRGDAKKVTQERDAERFINSMLRLEMAGASTVGDRLGEVTNVIPLGVSLRALEGEGIWSQSDVAKFRSLLRIRNSMVHDDEIPEPSILSAALEDAERLMRMLEAPDADRTRSEGEISG